MRRYFDRNAVAGVGRHEEGRQQRSDGVRRRSISIYLNKICSGRWRPCSRQCNHLQPRELPPHMPHIVTGGVASKSPPRAGRRINWPITLLLQVGAREAPHGVWLENLAVRFLRASHRLRGCTCQGESGYCRTRPTETDDGATWRTFSVDVTQKTNGRARTAQTRLTGLSNFSSSVSDRTLRGLRCMRHARHESNSCQGPSVSSTVHRQHAMLLEPGIGGSPIWIQSQTITSQRLHRQLLVPSSTSAPWP